MTQTVNNNAIKDKAIKPKKRRRSFWRVLYSMILYSFALFGLGVIGAWAIFQLGLTKDSGSVDKNNRYLTDISKMENVNLSQKEIDAQMAETYLKLAAISKFYPRNAYLISEGFRNSKNDVLLRQMVASCELSLKDNQQYQSFLNDERSLLNKVGTTQSTTNAITWMNTPEWESLKVAISKDKTLIDSAAKVTGVEPRMIVSCLIGEQIRLFNSKREMYKKYLGPVKVLSVQSKFSLGVNGIKAATAELVESYLKNATSPFYMGKKYEHILDFSSANSSEERVSRLVDYHNHYYSYVYTGCILHQTRNQWQRAGFDISTRPEILFTLFNLGFGVSKPSANPECGGSHITVGDKVYTFGAIGFDFYYSGELSNIFPYHKDKFID